MIGANRTKKIEFEQTEQTEVEIIEEEESDAYSLFVYAMRSQVTKDYWTEISLNHNCKNISAKN